MMTHTKPLLSGFRSFMLISKVHTCPSQIKIAEGMAEPPARKCRCRKYINTDEARRMCENGEASWVVIRRTQKEVELPCHSCKGDPEVKNCANCRGSGREAKLIRIPSYGDDIVLVSRLPEDKKEKKRSSTLAMKTPRVATIEKMHILKAYVTDVVRDLVAWVQNSDSPAGEWDLTEDIELIYNRERASPKEAKASRDRIEEYGLLILDARTYVGKDRIPAIKPEPENDLYTHQGRDYDRGVPAISFPSCGGTLVLGVPQKLIKDPPPNTSVYSATNAAHSSWFFSARHRELLDYSLQKLQEGDGTFCGEYVICCGINWRRDDPEVVKRLT
jgi:hypothetical protein